MFPFVLMVALTALEREPAADVEQGVGIETRMGGAPLTLAKADVPRVVVPVWFGCQTLCPTLLQGVRLALAKVSTHQRTLVLVSFAKGETPADAEKIRRSFAGETVEVVTGDDAVALLESAGFSWVHDGVLNQEVHPVSLFIATKDSKLSAYLPGAWPSAEALSNALSAAEEGKVMEAPQGLALNCFRFDPAARRWVGVLRWWLPTMVVLTLAAVLVTARMSMRRVKVAHSSSHR